jgi:hypothetical protein
MKKTKVHLQRNQRPEPCRNGDDENSGRNKEEIFLFYQKPGYAKIINRIVIGRYEN